MSRTRRAADDKPRGPLAGRRSTDPEHPGFWFRVGQLVNRWPIHTGLLVAFLIVAPITIVNVIQWQRVSAQNQRIQGNRVLTTFITCRVFNLLARSQNGQTAYVADLVGSGPERTKVLEPLFRRYGAAPYAERKLRAKARATALRTLSVPALNCEAFASLVRNRDVLDPGFIIPYDPPQYPAAPHTERRHGSAPGAGH